MAEVWMLGSVGPRGTTEVVPFTRTLAHHFLLHGFLHGHGTGAAGRALHAIAELANINLQLGDGAAEGVAMHAKFASGAALIAAIFLEHGENKALLEFAYPFRIKNVAFIHLQDECFELIFHVASLSCLPKFVFLNSVPSCAAHRTAPRPSMPTSNAVRVGA